MLRHIMKQDSGQLASRTENVGMKREGARAAVTYTHF